MCVVRIDAFLSVYLVNCVGDVSCVRRNCYAEYVCKRVHDSVGLTAEIRQITCVDIVTTIGRYGQT